MPATSIATMPLSAVIGTGTWGSATSAACHAAASADVVLWGRDPEKVEALRTSRRHPKLADYRIPDGVEITHDRERLRQADLWLWAVPTQHSRSMARNLRAWIAPEAMVVSLAKGLEHETRCRVSEILNEELAPSERVGCVTGPSHAEEVMAGRPAALVAAGPEPVRCRAIERLFNNRLRLYHVDDLLGAELCGALKNVIAVAAGICSALDLGDNAAAALITRGLAEIRRLGRALGADDATFAGLAGMGDLIATCYSPHGRNRALGRAIAAGETLEDHQRRTGMVAEGAWTCRAAVDLADRHAVEVPIASQVASVLWAGKDVGTALDELLTRTVKDEDA